MSVGITALSETTFYKWKANSVAVTRYVGSPPMRYAREVREA